MRIRTKRWAGPELAACPYYIKSPADYKGGWQKNFQTPGPIHLDLGCGKGVFLAAYARNHPKVNVVGIDISQDILGVARRNVQAAFDGEAPQNVALMQQPIEKICDVFSPADDIRRIFINFCNPWPKARAHKKRLTHPLFLERYLLLLQANGELWFKTDNADLFMATRRYFARDDLTVYFETEHLETSHDADNILTEHELMFMQQGMQIYALRARVNNKESGFER